MKDLKKNLKEWFSDLGLTLGPLGHCLLIAFFAFIGDVIPVAYIFTHLETLRYFWIPLLVAYWLLLSVVARQLIRRRELIEERFLYGDELFFQVYPRLKRAEERKQRRRAWLNERLTRIREGY